MRLETTAATPGMRRASLVTQTAVKEHGGLHLESWSQWNFAA